MESENGSAYAVPLLEDPTFYLIDGAAALGNLVIKKVTTGIAQEVVRSASSGSLKLDLQFFCEKRSENGK